MSGNGRVQLAAWAESQLQRLIERASDDIVERIPDHYGIDDSKAVHVDELRAAVAQNLRSAIHGIATSDPSFELDAPRRTGRRRAQQGVPLPEVLRAYRICFATMWDAMVAHVRRQPITSDTLVEVATLFWRFTDDHAVALTEGYREAASELLLAQERRRSAVVEALLLGHHGPEGSSWEAASLLGISPESELVVVVADTRNLAEESLPDAEAFLASRGFVSGWRLTALSNSGSCPSSLAVSMTCSRPFGRSRPREQASARRSEPSPTRHAPFTWRVQRSSEIPIGQVGVAAFDDSPIAALMVCEPAEGRRLAAVVLGGVLDQAPEDRDLLLQTLDVYLDSSGSAEKAAVELYCHPNTGP